MRTYRIDQPAIAVLNAIEPGEYRPKDIYKIFQENNIFIGTDISSTKIATLVNRLPDWENNGQTSRATRWIKRPASAKSVATRAGLAGTEERLGRLESIVDRLAVMHNFALSDLSL